MFILISILLAILNCTGLTILVIPSTKNTLKIFDPMILPIAILVLDLRTAVTDVTSSGNEVPTARIVSQTSFSDRHRDFARKRRLSTVSLPPSTSPASPAINSTTAILRLIACTTLVSSSLLFEKI